MDLVVGSSEATMKALLSKLGGLLAHEYALIRGVRGDIQYINDELASMQAFLGDISATTPHGLDRRMKDWMKQIRDVTYDIEDCIDDFAHRLSKDPGGDVCCAFFVTRIYEVWTWQPRRDIASSIAELKVRAQQISERRMRYGVRNPREVRNKSGDRTTGFDAAENQHTILELIGTKIPVGVDKDMEELGKWIRVIAEETKAPTETEIQQSQKGSSEAGQQPTLSGQKPSRDQVSQTQPKMQAPGVLSIVGFGGVGKTTIATVLFRKFGDQFDRRAIVTVSQSSDIEAILRSILIQVMPQSEDGLDYQGRSGGAQEKKWLKTVIGSICSTVIPKVQQDGSTSKKAQVNIQIMKLEQLKEELKKHLNDCSYLLLIDDVWSATTWEQIKKALPASNRSSRVMVTTRFKAVASTCKRDKGDYFHKVGELDEAKAKELLMEAVAEENQKKIPPRLWKMCGGLPLVIVIMSGLVACNPEKSMADWKQVCHTLVPDSVQTLAQDGVTRILNHCYNDMNAEIKTCSLYLSIFPKGCIISRKRLTKRWIAEGFVSEKQGLSVEDVAEAYFNHLRMRKIIRAVEHSSNGKVKSYQVHDMILEYIVSKASEENFITVVGGHWLMAPPSSKVRRLSLQGSDSKHGSVTESMNLSHVRSLTMFGSLTQLPSKSFKFGIVQVLDLEGCKDFKPHHTKEICKMLLLKYLSLRKTDIKRLPKKIGKLKYLETLDIRETNVTELPKTICQLERIVNILGGNKRTRKALKLPLDMKKKTMKALRILSGIEIVEAPTTVADLHHLTDLRKLTIFKLNLKMGGKLFEDLSSSIEYLGGYSLHTLVIDDESADFLKSLSALSSPPKFLNALELSGKLVELPQWIAELDALTKLTLSVTVLKGNALENLKQLRSLFSLTFSLTAAKLDPETAAIIEENKAQSDGEIIVPAGGFDNLKLLRFSAPFVPLLSFPDNAMSNLERLELRFSILEGVHGIENLKSLTEVHLRVHDKAGDNTKMIVEDIATAAREDEKGPRVIIDQYHD